jgi:hypothetical protein
MIKMFLASVAVGAAIVSISNVQANNYSTMDNVFENSSVVLSSSGAIRRPPHFNPPSNGGKPKINPPSR